MIERENSEFAKDWNGVQTILSREWLTTNRAAGWNSITVCIKVCILVKLTQDSLMSNKIQVIVDMLVLLRHWQPIQFCNHYDLLYDMWPLIYFILLFKGFTVESHIWC